VRRTPIGHGDCATQKKARRAIGLKEIHCKIVARGERRLRCRIRGRSLYLSMFARFRQVNKQLLRDLDEDQVQHLCTAISILRNTATQLSASSSIAKTINSKQSMFPR
jgi:hypothetical protein